METAVMPTQEFWNDGGVWIAESVRTQEGEALAKFAAQELQVKNWCFFQTSGTEGRRKWVGLSKESLLVSAQTVNSHHDISRLDHWLLALPLCHVGGFGVLARSFVSGSKVSQFHGKWDAPAFARQCEEIEATLTSLVPTQVFDLVASKLKAPGSMRAVLVGGGALNSEIEAAALDLGWPVRKTYGMTETASQVASQSVTGGEMEVLPIWQLETDATGLLTVRGEALAQGYAVHDEDHHWLWEPISAGLGLRTRDRVILWHEGDRRLLRFAGRDANTIKIMGELVALGPIQDRIDALRLRLGLSEGDAAVCDLPDARKEAKLVLVVSGMSLRVAEQLKTSLNSSLRPYERVEDVRLTPSIPRNELGKPLLGRLRSGL